jgi:hypothetical protein
MRKVGLACIAALGVACGVDVNVPSAIVRDSAGVTVVVSQRPGSPAWWSVDSTPALSIGTAEGEEAYQLHRVGSAALLPDGMLAIGTSGSCESRLYDRTGTVVRAIGRGGEGPGEFSRYTSIPLWPRPDGSIIAEAAANRLNVFDASGSLRRQLVLDPRPTSATGFPIGGFPNGDVLATAFRGELEGAPGSVVGSTSLYLRFDSAGRLSSTLLEAPGRLRMVHQFGETIHYPFLPLSPELLASANGDRLATITTAEPVVELRGADGALETVARWSPPRRATSEVWERFQAEDLARAGDSPQRAVYEDYYRQTLPLPQWVPAARRLVSDAEDHLWVERFRLPWEAGSTWDVLTGEGRWLTTVELPAGGTIYQIGPDFVLGRWRSEDGVEVVRLHRLRRGV